MNASPWIESLRAELVSVREVLPELLAAVGLVLIGAIAARVVQIWSIRAVGALDRVAPGRGIEGGLRRFGVDRPASEVIGSVLFWVVLAFFVVAATEALGLGFMATWLGGVTALLPKILVAILVLFAGVLASNFIRDAVAAGSSAAGLTSGALLGRVAQAGILLATFVTAMDQLGVDSTFVTAASLVLLAAVTGGIGLAFGIGAAPATRNVLAAHYVRRHYQVGQTVEIGGLSGEILAITRHAVVIEDADGRRALVPARTFDEQISILETRSR